MSLIGGVALMTSRIERRIERVAMEFAQQAGGSGLTMPYEKNFWGHVGVSLGKSELDANCSGGLRCDKTDTVWRVYGGGRFNNIFGGEIGYTDFGDFTRNGGETDAQSFDFTLLAGIPFGSMRTCAARVFTTWLSSTAARRSISRLNMA